LGKDGQPNAGEQHQATERHSSSVGES
jgi:hypothetical protein